MFKIQCFLPRQMTGTKFKVLVPLSYMVICGLICFLLVSCSFVSKYDPGFVLRSLNQKHLKLLKKGMTEYEATAIMGKPQIQDEFYKADILFYYTTWDWADAAITKIECTPLVFENDQLIGWGLAFYKNYMHRDWLYNTDKIFSQQNIGK
jgi:hypothetical protein